MQKKKREKNCEIRLSCEKCKVDIGSKEFWEAKKQITSLLCKNCKRKEKIEKIINSVRGTSNFKQALTHSSFRNEFNDGQILDYETLEFLGDSILDMQVCLYIYRNYPAFSEGQMSKLKQLMVQESTLAHLSKEVGLNRTDENGKLEYLKLGEGEIKNGGADKDSILSDIFESFVAALHLEKGARLVKKFLDLTLFIWVKGKEDEVWDYKTQLQEFCQTQNNHLFYRVVKWRNQTADQQFVFEVYDSLGKICAQGQGKNKKIAQQEAARHALEKLGKLNLNR
jgi:ribonuclease-3